MTPLPQVAVWRFVGFVSTIVGLLCYALSTSFNYLFGDWNLLKIFLYSAFSFFICLWSLFAKVCQRSTSLRFKAHSAFLVLTITSVYSYFADKAVNGKPDAYSLISCVAFAIMSLSLSRQTQCGFEADLFYFFLGCLIVLLMKINLALAIVGVGLSYFLIILRSSLDTTSYQNLGVQDDSVVIDVNARMMQRLTTCINALQQGNSNPTNVLLERAKEYLKDKSELEGIDHNFLIDALPSEKIHDLRESINLMVGDVVEKTCCEVYCNWRRESLEACLFELQKIVIDEKRPRLPLDWDVDKILIRTLKAALRILFPSERRLCDRVFSGFPPVADFCFTEVCRGPVVTMLNFADYYASRDPCEVGLSNILVMFETLCDLIPEFHSLFPESLVKEAVTVRDKLEKACRDVFMKMEDKIFCNPFVKIVVRPDATDHPMTRCVMDYLELILEKYRKFADRTGTSSSVSDQINPIMKRLERELVARSKIYSHPALRHLFMMNNWSYIERRAAKLGLDDLDFFQNSATIVRQNLVHYQRSSWKMVLDFLKLEDDELVDAESIKDNLINEHIEFICGNQSTWLAYEDMLSEQQLIIPIVDDSKNQQGTWVP
ncbi:Exocyst complex component EXO70B1 [Spatholobus suberectus]|nr:Exocyst complex component EXO70B1 [Spatholobus suberectus]